MRIKLESMLSFSANCQQTPTPVSRHHGYCRASFNAFDVGA